MQTKLQMRWKTKTAQNTQHIQEKAITTIICIVVKLHVKVSVHHPLNTDTNKAHTVYTQGFI